MTGRNAAAERCTTAWLALLAACILLAGVAVLAAEAPGAHVTADEPVGQEETDAAAEGADGDPGGEESDDPAETDGPEADDAAPTTDAPAEEEGDAAPDAVDDGEVADAAPGAGLWGRWFRITEIRDGDDTRAPVGDVPYLVGFTREDEQDAARGSLRWRGPCNQFGAELAVAPARLLVGEVSGTAVGCEDALQEQDAAVTRALAESPEWTFDDGELVLRSQDRALLLVEAPGAAPPPEG